MNRYRIIRNAVTDSRRRQLARLAEMVELIATTKPRTEQEAADKEAAIADLMRRNTATRDSQAAV